MEREISKRTCPQGGIDMCRCTQSVFCANARSFRDMLCGINWFVAVFVLTFPVLLSGCMKDDDATVLLPLPVGTIVGVDVPEGLLDHIQVNEGTTPPSIEGYYMASPMQTEFASDDYWNAEYYNLYMAFSATGGRNNVSYKEKQNHSTGSSSAGRIIGNGNDFTIYFTSTMKDESAHWSCTTLTIISGSVADGGITHFQYANTMIEKQDPEHHLMEVGEYHVFHDGDGFVEVFPW